MIDSGVAATAELTPLLVGEVDAAARPARPTLRPRYDHGTKVATVLARAAEHPVSILSVRVDEPAGCRPEINPPCQRDPNVIAWAIYSAVAHRADVINISMALPNAPVITNAVRFASWHGTQVVLASGNDGRDVPGNLAHARAGYPNTVLVGALNPNGSRWSKSNRPAAEVTSGYTFAWRRGVDVPTALVDGSPMPATGTSIAAPIEAAVRARSGTAARFAVFVPLPVRSVMRRPVMLTGAVYPDYRSVTCKTRLRTTSTACFGAPLIV